MVASALFLVTLTSLVSGDQELEQVSMLQTKRASTLATVANKRCEVFFRHSSATGECPSGSRALLSVDECEIAAKQVLMPESGEFHKFAGSVESSQFPTGCFVGINPAGDDYGVFKWNSHSEGSPSEFADVVCFGFEPEDSIEQNLPGETCTFHMVKSKPTAPYRLATVEQILEKYCTKKDGCSDEGIINELGIGMWVVAGLEDGQIDGKGHWNDAQSTFHDSFGHSDAVEPRHQTGFGDWIEARCSLTGAPPPPEAVVPPTEIFIENVCLSAMGDQPGALPVPVDACVESIDIKHRSGRVSCRKAETGLSNFGCDANSLGLVMADGDRVVAPVVGATQGLTPHYAAHAHWYKLPNVGRDSEEMTWKFTEPFLINRGDYHMWYHEDLSGGTEGDNSGSACYDVTLHKKESSHMCSARAPMMYHKVCVGASANQAGHIHLPEDTCVKKIDVTWTTGWVSCHHDGEGHKSHFGCGGNLVGLVFTKDNNVLVPTEANTNGMTKTHHDKAHWYTMQGVGQNSRTLTFDLKQQQKWSGDYNLWYAEDLTGWTEEDNAGRACYDVTVHRGTSC